MKKLAVILSLSVVMALLVGSSAVLAGVENPPIKVGVVLPLSGDLSKFGEIEKNSFIMAQEEVNAAGGVKGRPIELLFADDASRVDTGRSAVERLIDQEQVVVLTGGYSSDVAHAVAFLAQHRHIPFVITTGAADMITEMGWDYVFRLNQPVSEYSKTLIEFLQEVLKPKSVAILHDSGLFGRVGAIEFLEQATEMGWKIVMQEGYQPGLADFKPLLATAKAAQPDVVYMISYVREAALIMKQSRQLDFAPKVFAGAGAGFTMPEFSELAGNTAERVLSATLWTPHVPYPGAKEYHDGYLRRYGTEPDYHGAEAYASLQVVADALKRAKEFSPQAVREALVKTNLMTAFGPVRFTAYDNKTQQNTLPTYVVQWQQGVLQTVWPAIMATKPFAYSEE